MVYPGFLGLIALIFVTTKSVLLGIDILYVLVIPIRNRNGRNSPKECVLSLHMLAK